MNASPWNGGCRTQNARFGAKHVQSRQAVLVEGTRHAYLERSDAGRPFGEPRCTSHFEWQRADLLLEPLQVNEERARAHVLETDHASIGGGRNGPEGLRGRCALCYLIP